MTPLLAGGRNPPSLAKGGISGGDELRLGVHPIYFFKKQVFWAIYVNIFCQNLRGLLAPTPVFFWLTVLFFCHILSLVSSSFYLFPLGHMSQFSNWAQKGLYVWGGGQIEEPGRWARVVGWGVFGLLTLRPTFLSPICVFPLGQMELLPRLSQRPSSSACSSADSMRSPTSPCSTSGAARRRSACSPSARRRRRRSRRPSTPWDSVRVGNWWAESDWNEKCPTGLFENGK